MPRITRLPAVFIATPLVLLFFFLALDSLVGDSPTMDEQNHLVRGLAFLRTGDPRFSLEHPPLINTISALPLLSDPSIDLPTDHPSWNQREGWYAFANELLWERNNDVDSIIFLARLPIVFLTMALALVGYLVAGEFWGKLSALLSFGLLLFEPNILAHGRYTTTDVGSATFLLLATYSLWRLWSSDGWNWGRFFIAGISIGLALGSKVSMLIFLPIFALLACLPLYRGDWNWRQAVRRLGQLALASFLGLITLWVIYGLEWGPSRLLTPSMDFLDGVTMPMPTYWAGVEQILTLSQGGRPSFLLGSFSDTGWWYYFPVTFLVKTPIVLFLLLFLAIAVLLRDRDSRQKALYLLIPSGIYFLISMQSALNIGYRHLLPIIPNFLLLVSGLAREKPGTGRLSALQMTPAAALAVLGLGIVVLTDLLLHPHYLSYFNLLAGGPSNGHNVLVDSNLDWGQDMLRLKEWMAQNDVERIKLSWFGTANPDYYGIDYNALPGLPYHFDLWWDPPFSTDAPEAGIYAISASNLWELPLRDKHVFAWFRERTPDDRIGYSIHIYYVNADE